MSHPTGRANASVATRAAETIENLTSECQKLSKLSDDLMHQKGELASLRKRFLDEPRQPKTAGPSVGRGDRIDDIIKEAAARHDARAKAETTFFDDLTNAQRNVEKCLQEVLDQLGKRLPAIERLVKAAGVFERRQQSVIRQAVALAELRKSRANERKARREIAAIRDALKKSETFRTTAGFSSLNWSNRWSFEQAEAAARRYLAKLQCDISKREAEKKAQNPSRVLLESSKNLQAMVERGVTFDRMVR